jgi:hypothetical protein
VTNNGAPFMSYGYAGNSNATSDGVNKIISGFNNPSSVKGTQISSEEVIVFSGLFSICLFMICKH